MMPFCEYKNCEHVAEDKPRLLRMWSSYDFRSRPMHTQEIWLCGKHLIIINDLLQIETSKTSPSKESENNGN